MEMINRPHRRSRSLATEAALKSAARRVFAAKGYFNTKITDITTEAGRSAGSFYTYFPNKEALLEALAADFLEDLEARQQCNAGRAAELSYDHLRAHVAQYWHSYREHLPEMVAIFQASMADQAFFARWRKLRDVEFDELREFTTILERHSAGDVDPGVMASAALSAVEFFCYIWQAAGGDPPGTRLTDDQAIDTLTTLLLHGMSGTPR
ncbi:TetR/AcrR family transcriptional regulator [Spongiactinospora gelatinilytica]|uniref:TetR/AcrR family transcriptional regulator n=2 Tax=Spongiactinospora gelatinilytica TaxID=2666298 RepID=A0A2W2H8X3_9ACTN|nr:TetR/AcrR family transcriptional regulator [Spongiactinospora gelatinilytica]